LQCIYEGHLNWSPTNQAIESTCTQTVKNINNVLNAWHKHLEFISFLFKVFLPCFFVHWGVSKICKILDFLELLLKEFVNPWLSYFNVNSKSLIYSFHNLIGNISSLLYCRIIESVLCYKTNKHFLITFNSFLELYTTSLYCINFVLSSVAPAKMNQQSPPFLWNI